MSLTVEKFSNKEQPSYAASTNGTISSGTLLNTTTSIAYLWHPAANTKRVEINKILVSFAAGSGGLLQVRGAFITAENGVPGGTVQIINPKDRDDPASTLTFRTGAAPPTRLAGDLYTDVSDQLKLEVGDNMTKPIVLRPGVDEGFEIRSIVGLLLISAQLIAVSYEWVEYDV